MPLSLSTRTYDVIVVGAGHAGCEAAVAASRMGFQTLLVTMQMDHVALMPCNPSIGGPAKGHLVREIDALGGVMGEVTDATFVQIRLLNTSKGPAVRALRAQSDKHRYGLAMRALLEREPRLEVIEAMVDDVLVTGASVLARRHGSQGERPWSVEGIRLASGETMRAPSVILTTGTSLRGTVHVGDVSTTAGRSGEAASLALPRSLDGLGFRLGRLKTGTPPRVRANSIDYDRTALQPGSPVPLHFSHWSDASVDSQPFPMALAEYPGVVHTGWRPQMPTYLVATNEATHAVIRENLDRAPMYNGQIESHGPRYCPSIETKIVRFAERTSHQVFLEPEGWETEEVYVQGMSTSLPIEVQDAMLRTIPALQRCDMIRPGYAIEYDFLLPGQITPWLETRGVAGLFAAGQINGTTGYEEAAAQGLLAGINAALLLRGELPYVPRRDEAYLGVLVDDLTTQDLTEPYRMFTSRAEYRLLLRHDNADTRLSAFGHQIGLLSNPRMEQVQRRARAIEATRTRLKRSMLVPGSTIERQLITADLPAVSRPTRAFDYLRRPDVSSAAVPILTGADAIDDVAERVEIAAKYDGYLDRQLAEAERLRRLEDHHLPAELDYSTIPGLRAEARMRLTERRPATVGQASRMFGVTPADVGVLLIQVRGRA
ncbi:MAG: tRNA uridine-5-carboxymethylaminomethyl(34) synthesis enzyme MnmG [Chloroflexota bacterium]